MDLVDREWPPPVPTPPFPYTSMRLIGWATNATNNGRSWALPLPRRCFKLTVRASKNQGPARPCALPPDRHRGSKVRAPGLVIPAPACHAPHPTPYIQNVLGPIYLLRTRLFALKFRVRSSRQQASRHALPQQPNERRYMRVTRAGRELRAGDARLLTSLRLTHFYCGRRRCRAE